MATTMYLKFEDPHIEGAAADPAHKGEIEVLSWNHGFVQPTRGEQATHQNFTFTKYLDASSNEIMKMCWSGKQFKKATLAAYRTGSDDKPAKYLEVVMEHVVISNFSISGGPGDIPVENISLDYGLVHYTYASQKGDQSISHDRLQNRVSS